MSTRPYPRSFSHIGLSVPDIEKAVEFYSNVLGFSVLMGPTEVFNDDSLIGKMCTAVFGGDTNSISRWNPFKIAHLLTADRIGIEIFEFPKSLAPNNNFEYWKTGIFHFCIEDRANFDDLIEQIVANGGKKRMKEPYFYYPDKPYRMIYMEDPFGNILELYSHSYAEVYSVGGYR